MTAKTPAKNAPAPAAAPADSAPLTGLPAKYYTDRDLFARIGERVFFRTWQYACHAGEIPNAGDYIAFDILDQQVFVIRDRAGDLRAFYNVCRHRGHRLLDGDGDGNGSDARNRGHCNVIVCPYHGWSYELDGALRRAPNAHRVAGFDRRAIRLAHIALEEFLGFVFVNLDADAAPMERCYPGVRDAMLALCPTLETRAFAYEYAVNEGCNWLIAVENYNECYHCQLAHPAFAEGVIDPDSYDIAPFGGYCLRHTSRATRSARAWYDVSGSDYGSFYLWPAVALQVYPGGVVNGYYWRPLAVDDTEVHRVWYAPGGEVSAQLQKIIDLDRDTTFAEDLRLVRSVQRGMNSRGFAPGPLMLDPDGGIGNELSVATLHRWLRAALEPEPGA